MKYKKYILFFLSTFVVLNISCNKPELAQPDLGKVINVQIGGSSEVDLEYVYKDNVVATSLIASSKNIVVDMQLLIKEEGATLQIRKKGSSEILQTKQLSSSPFIQNFNVFYDGTTVYENAVTLLIKGYVLSGELEFLVDGKVVLAGTGAIDNNNNRTILFMNKGTSREIQVRKKGETEILLTKTIDAAPGIQNLNFFFDGKALVDNVKLDPPANPANMMVRAKFETIFPNQFKNVDIDLVFYTKLLAAANTVIGTKVVPELRFKLPKDGSFQTFELPPLPGSDYFYTFDIVESGTNLAPYTSGMPLVLSGYSIKPNEGRSTSQYATDPIKFEAGKSKLLLLTDQRTLAVVAGTKSVFISGGRVTDLSQYFK